MATSFPQVTASQISLHEANFIFSNAVAPFFLGLKETGTTFGFKTVSVDEIAVSDNNGGQHFYAHVIGRPYYAAHSADEDPDDPLIHVNWSLKVPNDIWESIRASMPVHFRGVVPDQAVFYFRKVPVQLENEGNVRQLLSGERQSVYVANQFAVKWLKPDADDPSDKDPSMRFKTSECPFELWTHGSRKQALDATIQEIRENLMGVSLNERTFLDQRLNILEEAQNKEKEYETAQKRLMAQEKKLRDARARLAQNPTDEQEMRRFTNDSKKIDLQIQNFQKQIRELEQDLINYKNEHRVSLPNSYCAATLQAGFSINYGSFLHTKRLTTDGNVTSSGLLALPATRDDAERSNTIASANRVHKPY